MLNLDTTNVLRNFIRSFSFLSSTFSGAAFTVRAYEAGRMHPLHGTSFMAHGVYMKDSESQSGREAERAVTALAISDK